MNHPSKLAPVVYSHVSRAGLKAVKIGVRSLGSDHPSRSTNAPSNADVLSTRNRAIPLAIVEIWISPAICIICRSGASGMSLLPDPQLTRRCGNK